MKTLATILLTTFVLALSSCAHKKDGFRKDDEWAKKFEKRHREFTSAMAGQF